MAEKGQRPSAVHQLCYIVKIKNALEKNFIKMDEISGTYFEWGKYLTISAHVSAGHRDNVLYEISEMVHAAM